jgi:hypothetical protein
MHPPHARRVPRLRASARPSLSLLLPAATRLHPTMFSHPHFVPATDPCPKSVHRLVPPHSPLASPLRPPAAVSPDRAPTLILWSPLDDLRH